MAESKVGVRPSTTTGSVDVIVDAHGGKVWPVYKAAYGDADNVTRVDEDHPLPILDAASNFAMQDLLGQILVEMKINNAYQALIWDDEINEEDLNNA